MKHKHLQDKFNSEMEEDVKTNAGLKATALVFFLYVPFFLSFYFNAKLTITITLLASILVFMIVFTSLVWLGLRKYFEETRYKKKIKKLKKLRKKTLEVDENKKPVDAVVGNFLFRHKSPNH